MGNIVVNDDKKQIVIESDHRLRCRHRHEEMSHVFCTRKRKHKGKHVACDLGGGFIAEWNR